MEIDERTPAKVAVSLGLLRQDASGNKVAVTRDGANPFAEQILAYRAADRDPTHAATEVAARVVKYSKEDIGRELQPSSR